MMSSSEASTSSFNLGPLQPLKTHYTRLNRQYRSLLDRAAPHLAYRWLGTAGLVMVFMLRIVFAQGWYIICYALGIYLLNLLLAFLQPKFDPSLEADLTADEIEEGGADTIPSLPSQKDDEFRPFVRRLPEWNFWLSSTRATFIALLCTFSESFDIPVYWPILVIYFFILFTLTMRRQIQHMIKYKYIPFDFGRKVRYGSR
ncbi:retrieval of early ER protein Rer1 [Fomitiporia mediterranea MF3/22]|uniref:retrieval of early ER protein Rer1 n=1 Tax=Fomitiporia mediterranea (strain MF3/22) TaxID=694068 RepID=UPI000440922A|nr:retrieval of early ER protein Rer1 [Fomitiporia mediterranea MF3/22]EJD08044.1 retrieval of early ER protein Rer1 [Fomitiporia mediterranea MF3/22]